MGGRRWAAADPRWHALLLSTVHCLLSTGATAQGQTIRLYVPDSVEVGQRFGLAVATTSPASVYPVFPAAPLTDPEAGPPLTLGDAEVFYSRRLPPRLSGTTRTDSVVYEAALFALDSARVGPMEVRFVTGGDTTTRRSGPAWVRVRTVVAPAAALRPPTGPLPFPPGLEPTHVGAGAAALALAALGVWAWRRRRGARPAASSAALDPHAEALARLDALGRAALDTDGAVKAHYVELADVVRTYLARRLGLPARERTTPEVEAALAADARLPAPARLALVAALRAADSVKFARRRPDADAASVARAQARAGVEAAEASLTGEPAPHPS